MKKIVVLSNTAFSIEKFRLHYLKRLSGYAIDIYTPDPKIKINSNTYLVNNINTLKKGSSTVFFNTLEITSLKEFISIGSVFSM